MGHAAIPQENKRQRPPLASLRTPPYIKSGAAHTGRPGFQRRRSDARGPYDAADGNPPPAISAKPRRNLAFYRGLLGMRLIRKTVNQDDVSAYHLFYAEKPIPAPISPSSIFRPLRSEKTLVNSRSS
jgi:hypothetical protein